MEKRLIKMIKQLIGRVFYVGEDKAPEQETIDRIKDSVDFRGAKLWILIFAIFVASLGLNTNSTAVIIGAMLTAQVGSNYQAAQEKTDEKRKVLTFYNEKMKMFASRYAALCNEKQLVYDTESNQRTVLDKLSAKVNGLNPGLFKNETAGMQLNAIVNKCELLIDEAETATAEQLPEVDRKMKRFVEKALLEIDMLQNLAKG